MEPLSPLPDGATRVARALAAAWAEPELSAALSRGARLLAELYRAQVSGLFVVSDEEIGAEGWFPEPKDLPLEQRVRFQRAALEGPHVDPRDFTSTGALVTRRFVNGPEPQGEKTPLVLAWVRDSNKSGPVTEDGPAEALLEVLAHKVSVAREGARHRARQEQYERWFKTLDAQLRILDRERQKFAAVANQTDTYAFVTDGSRSIRWLNKALAALVGGDVGTDWTGRVCLDLCGKVGLKDADAPCDECPVMRAFEANTTVHREISGAPGGRELYLTALPIRGPDGRALEVLGQIQDLTNLEVVRRAKERIEAVISGAPVILFAVDREGTITLSEGRSLEALGRRPGQSVGSSIFELYGDVPHLESYIRRALEGETVTATVDVKDRAFDAYYGPLRGSDGSVQGVIGVATDVTERRRAERALQESEDRLRHAQRIEAVGSLAGGIAHDFNNLLTAMFGHLKFLRERLDAESALHTEVEAVERAANRAASLTRQLLAFSRKQVLQLRVVDLNEVVREMEPMLRRLIREDIDLLVQVDAAMPWIRADIGQMEQVIVNLAVNARDAMPHGGRLTLRTFNVDPARMERTPMQSEMGGSTEPLPPGAYVGLVVRDTGLGMEPAVQARAFEPFFTTKPVGEGTGLGLSTVYGIVKQSGGEVFLTSAPGSGATFTLFFPTAEAPPQERSGSSSSPMLAPGNETILLVEDELMVRELFRDVLRTAGYTVLEARGGAEALEIVARHHGPIHLMVTDVVMPGMGGGELVHRMSEIRPEVKVLYVSGYTDDVLVRRGVIDSEVSFLQKPCMPDELARLVRQILG